VSQTYFSSRRALLPQQESEHFLRLVVAPSWVHELSSMEDCRTWSPH